MTIGRTRAAANLTLATVVLLGLAACASGSSSGSSGSSGGASGSGQAAGDRTMTWLVNASKTDVYEQLAKDFEAANPGVSVTLNKKVADTDTNRANIINTLAGGSATPDIFSADVVWTAQFASKKLIADLSGKFSDTVLNSFDKATLDTGQYNGKQYCLPVFTDAGVLYYRSDLLKDAGLDVPTTWDQLSKEAAQLQTAGKVKYGLVYRGAPYEGTTVFWTELMADAGGAPLNADNTQVQMNSGAAKTAMDFLKSTITSKISPAAVSTFKEAESLAVFANGDAAFMSSNAYVYGGSQDPASSKVIGKVAMAPLPTFTGAAPGFSGSGGGNYCVNPNSKNVDLDVKAIEFLASTAAQQKFATVGKLVPANKAAQGDPALAKALPVLPLLAKLKIVNRPAGTPNYAALSRAIFTNVNAALSGTAGDQALKDMQEQSQAALK